MGIEEVSPLCVLSSVVAALIIAVIAVYVLDSAQQTVDQSFSSPTTVRYPHEENIHNLVGKDWNYAKEH